MVRAFKLVEESVMNYLITYKGVVVATLACDGDNWSCSHKSGCWSSDKLNAVFDSGAPTIGSILSAHPFVSAATLKRKLAR